MRFSGTVPNTEWKAYPLDLLYRENPRYIPVGAEGSFVSRCTTLGDVHLLRQRSSEWKNARNHIRDADSREYSLISTASTVGYMLGFLEPKSAEILGIPPWMVSHEKSLSSMKRKDVIHSEPTKVNFSWGTNHESNAIKSLLDCQYLNERYPGFHIEESGMWPMNIARKDETSCLIGASLDGILTHEGKPISIIETKCVSPFSWDKELQLYNYRKAIPYECIYPLYVAQIQMQLLIAEDSFAVPLNTIFTSWTPTVSTSIFEVDHHREYTSLMSTLLRQMRDEFFSTGIDPPENFWHDEDHKVYSQYQRFLSLTREICEYTHVVTKIPSFVYGGGDIFLNE